MRNVVEKWANSREWPVAEGPFRQAMLEGKPRIRLTSYFDIQSSEDRVSVSVWPSTSLPREAGGYSSPHASLFIEEHLAALAHEILNLVKDPPHFGSVEEYFPLESLDHMSGLSIARFNQLLEPFMAVVVSVLHSEEIGDEERLSGEHNLRQLRGELLNPQGPSAVVIRRYVASLLGLVLVTLDLPDLSESVGADRAEHIEHSLTEIASTATVDSDKDAEIAEVALQELELALPGSECGSQQMARAVGWLGVRGTAAVLGAGAGAGLASEIAQLPKWGVSPLYGALIGAVLAVAATFAPGSKPNK